MLNIYNYFQNLQILSNINNIIDLIDFIYELNEYYFIKKYLNRFQVIIYMNINDFSYFLIKNCIFQEGL